MPRLFVALDPPAPVRDALAALRADVPGARWTPPEKMHLTLAFLGEVPDERVPAIEAALAGVTAGPVEVVLAGLDAFPNRRAARVLVAGVVVAPALAGLHAQVSRAVAAVGVETEARPFRPHLTLARLKEADRHAVGAFLAQPLRALAFEAEAFHLYATRLHPEGARYQRLRSFVLA
jgi:2'-5' RNA ligase